MTQSKSDVYDEVVSCMPIPGRYLVVATTKYGNVFIGSVRTGGGPEIVWTKCTNIPLHTPSTP